MHFTIDIHADTLCPWSYLQKKSLERAIEMYSRTRDDASFELFWRPFILSPELKPSGVPKSLIYQQLAGSPSRLSTMCARLQHAAQALNATVNLNLSSGTSGGSLLSHRLLYLILLELGPAAQNRLIEAVWSAHFGADGVDISDPSVLAELAARETGMSAETVRMWLDDEQRGTTSVEREAELARADVRGVPAVTVQGRYRVGGYQEPGVFVSLFERIQISQGQ